MSLRFALADRQLRIFRFALQSLQKVGSELLLEALPAGGWGVVGVGGGLGGGWCAHAATAVARPPAARPALHQLVTLCLHQHHL